VIEVSLFSLCQKSYGINELNVEVYKAMHFFLWDYGVFISFVHFGILLTAQIRLNLLGAFC
jgi:hypothetical protein